MSSKQSPLPLVPRSILVAVDAGGLSDNAIGAALDLADRFDARIELVHAFGSPALSWAFVPEPHDVIARTDAESRATQFVVAHVRALLAARTGRPRRAEDLVRVIPGRPAKVILDRALAVRADLIVLGALQRRPTVDFGSTARAVLSKSSCAVWVQPGVPAAVRRILVPVDLSEESLLALGTACALAAREQASVHALHVFEYDQLAAVPWDGYGVVTALDEVRKASLDGFEAAMRQFDWKGVDHTTSFTDGRAADEILTAAKQADLVVMGTHGRSGFTRALLGSIAYEVLKLSTRPVLVVRAAERKFESP